MTKKVFIVSLSVVVFAFASLTPALYAENLTVNYLEGILKVQSPSGWREIFIGDTVSDSAMVRLEGLGSDPIAELDGKGGTPKITLSSAGTYQLKELLAASGNLASTGIGSLIMGKMQPMLLKSKVQEQGVVGGVRGDVVTEQVSFYDTEELVKTGKELFEKGNYYEALKALDEAASFAMEEEQPEIRFYQGLIHTVQGNNGKALDALADVKQDPEDEFYAALVLLKAQLLVESFAYQKAITWLEEFENRSVNSGKYREALQSAYLLSGLSYREIKNTGQAKEHLIKSISLNPDSETAKAASSLLATLK
ncbi:MAG: tetratricopeptide repeat protein [Spirochaetota bacterium]